jgi:hypothetical protein
MFVWQYLFFATGAVRLGAGSLLRLKREESPFNQRLEINHAADAYTRKILPELQVRSEATHLSLDMGMTIHKEHRGGDRSHSRSSGSGHRNRQRFNPRSPAMLIFNAPMSLRS